MYMLLMQSSYKLEKIISHVSESPSCNDWSPGASWLIEGPWLIDKLVADRWPDNNQQPLFPFQKDNYREEKPPESGGTVTDRIPRRGSVAQSRR